MLVFVVDNLLLEMKSFFKFDLVLAKHNLPSRTFRLGIPATSDSLL